MTALLILQCILTWATLSGMAVLALHTAVQVSDEFREWIMDAIRPHVNDAMFQWGAGMSQKFGALLFTWVWMFFLPLTLTFGTLALRAVQMYAATHQLKRQPTIKEWSEKEKAVAEESKLRLYAGIARVAHNAIWAASDDESITLWDGASATQRADSIDMVKAILMGQETDSMDPLFEEVVRSCAESLGDMGICVAWIPRADETGDATKASTAEVNDEADLFPQGPTQ